MDPAVWFQEDMIMDCKLRAKNCGGCPMLATEYAAQLKKKEADVRALLGKYGPVSPIRGMETPYHYRNKVISTFAPAAGGKLTSGIYAARTHKVLPVESCLLQDEVLDKVMLAVRAAANACRYQPFNEDKGTGLLRHCLLRRGVATGQVMVVLVTAQPVLPGAKNFVKALLAEAEKRGVPVTTVVQNYNPRRTSVVLGEDEKVLYGKGFILDTLCGKTYALSPRSFYQVNPVQTAVLYGLAVDAAHLTGKEVVLDAYCGIGTIGLTASDKARQVVGVEVNRDAVRDAIGNAKHNGVKNARFFAADATAWIREAADAGQKADVVFMDPPREGSTPAFIESVARMAPKRIVYVSCNPETMARDLALLIQKGSCKIKEEKDMSSFSGIKNTLLAEQVEEQLYEYITKLPMKAGDKLPNEFKLAEMFGVGRSTVREAVKLLVSRNVLETRRGSGTYVKDLVPTDLDPLNLRNAEDKVTLAMNLVDLRLILEPGIAELAAYNATDEEIEHLKDLCDTVEYKIDHDLYYIQDDIDFHTYIARCSKNKVVEQIISIIETAVLMFVNLTHRRLRQETIITHRAITKSIAEHDPVGARSAMTMHISYNRAAIKEIYDARNRELENQEQ